MANIERIVEQAPEKLGGEFQPLLTGPQIAQMLQEGRIRIGRYNNALCVEFDGEAYTLPDGFMVDKFP